jgi:hypothetical protein
MGNKIAAALVGLLVGALYIADKRYDFKPWGWTFERSYFVVIAALVVFVVVRWSLAWFRDGNEGVKAQWRRFSEYSPSPNTRRKNLIFWLVIFIALLIFFYWRSA